jgi:hypothetical protein
MMSLPLHLDMPRAHFWAQPVLALLRFVRHSFADLLVHRMTCTHDGLCVQVNENFSGTGGKRSGGRKRNSTLIDLLDKASLIQSMLDMVHLGSKVCSATA